MFTVDVVHFAVLSLEVAGVDVSVEPDTGADRDPGKRLA